MSPYFYVGLLAVCLVLAFSTGFVLCRAWETNRTIKKQLGL